MGNSLKFLSVLLLSLAASSAYCRTWHVAHDGSGDFFFVQAGIAAATEGDTVLVAAGTYFENLTFAGVDIVLKSSSGPLATRLDGSAVPGPVLSFLNGESNACVVEGFAITGGLGREIVPQLRAGGGIYIQDSEPSIINNIITGNQALGSLANGIGGGVYCIAKDPDQTKPLRRPRFISNLITLNISNGNGGGLAFRTGVAPEIHNNDISNNQANGGDGGGLWFLVHNTDVTSISNNKITNNIAYDHGGGVYAGTFSVSARLDLRLEGNLISDNLARGLAGTGDDGTSPHSLDHFLSDLRC